MRKLTIKELKENLGEKQFNKVVELIKELKTMNEGFELTLKSNKKKSLKESRAEEIQIIKNEVDYYLFREATDEEALEILEIIDRTPHADMTEIIMSYYDYGR